MATRRLIIAGSVRTIFVSFRLTKEDTANETACLAYTVTFEPIP